MEEMSVNYLQEQHKRVQKEQDLQEIYTKIRLDGMLQEQAIDTVAKFLDKRKEIIDQITYLKETILSRDKLIVELQDEINILNASESLFAEEPFIYDEQFFHDDSEEVAFNKNSSFISECSRAYVLAKEMEELTKLGLVSLEGVNQQACLEMATEFDFLSQSKLSFNKKIIKVIEAPPGTKVSKDRTFLLLNSRKVSKMEFQDRLTVVALSAK